MRPAGESPAARGADRVYLVDASVYVFRSYFSLTLDFFDRDGNPAHAVYGFVGFLCTLLEQTAARHIGICFDESLDSSFRNEIYPDYKANREPAPVELKRQFTHCRAVAEGMGIECFSSERFEADDLIGTLAARKRRRGHAITVVSSDKDLAQILETGDQLWDFARNRRLGQTEVEARFGVRPSQMADFLALTGDAVDNIPGVPGIGPKSAAAILSHFGSVDEMLRRLDELPYLSFRGAKAAHRRIRDHLEHLELARQLTRIVTDAPIPSPEPALRWTGPDIDALNDLFDYLNFGRLLRQRCASLEPPAAASDPVRPSAAASSRSPD